MHLHAGSKPFKCPYCTSKFNLKGNLSRHMKVKHGMDVSPEGQGKAHFFKNIKINLSFYYMDLYIKHGQTFVWTDTSVYAVL